jgi:hypothetical protein
MLEYRFPQGQFSRHDIEGLILKHSLYVAVTWLYAHEQLDHELPFENATSWEEVQERLNPKDETITQVTSSKEQARKEVEIVKQKLLQTKQLKKKEEEKIKVVKAERVRLEKEENGKKSAI